MKRIVQIIFTLCFLLLSTIASGQEGIITVIDSLELATVDMRSTMAFTFTDTMVLVFGMHIHAGEFAPSLHLVEIDTADYSITSEIEEEQHEATVQQNAIHPMGGIATASDSLVLLFWNSKDADDDGHVFLKEIDVGDGDIIANYVDDLEYDADNMINISCVALPDHTDYWVLSANSDGGNDQRNYMIHRNDLTLVLDEEQGAGTDYIPHNVIHTGDSIIVNFGRVADESLVIGTMESNPDGGDLLQAIEVENITTMSDCHYPYGFEVEGNELGDTRNLMFVAWVNEDSNGVQFGSVGVDSVSGAIDNAFIDSVYTTNVYGNTVEGIGNFIPHPGDSKLGILTWRDTSNDFYVSTITIDADGTNIAESFIDTYKIGVCDLNQFARTEGHVTAKSDSCFLVSYMDSADDLWLKTLTIGYTVPAAGWAHKVNGVTSPKVNGVENTDIQKVNSVEREP